MDRKEYNNYIQSTYEENNRTYEGQNCHDDNNIDYNNYDNLESIIFELNNILNEIDDEELEILIKRREKALKSIDTLKKYGLWSD